MPSSLCPLCAVPVQPGLTSFFEFTGDRMVCGWSGTCSFQGAIERVVVLEQPTSRKLTCWLAREADAGVGGFQDFGLEPRAWRVSALLGGCSFTFCSTV